MIKIQFGLGYLVVWTFLGIVLISPLYLLIFLLEKLFYLFFPKKTEEEFLIVGFSDAPNEV